MIFNEDFMFRNYLKIAWRNLMKNKVFSFINITGLALGMIAFLLILQYVSFHLSFDRFNRNANDIYRVYNDRNQNGKLIQHGTITYSAISPAMQADFPEVVNHTRIEPSGKQIVTFGTKKIGEQNAFSVENSFLKMFSYPLIAGDPQTALKDPHSTILSQSLAKKIFEVNENNYESVLGNLITVSDDPVPFKITGICKDVPENSHLQFDFLISYITLYTGNHPWKQAEYDFTDSDFWHYIQLKHGTDYKALEAKFSLFSEKHFNGAKVSGSVEKFYLQPLLKAHLSSDFEYEIGNTASAIVVWSLFIIAMLIIVIAWVNYVNLATAKSMERAKEVGVRKVSGATKQQLIKQFLTESFIINFIALCLALTIVTLLQNSFNDLIKHQLSLSYLFQKGIADYNMYLVLIVMILTGVFISGFYPALVLSSFKPVLLLKGKYVASKKGIELRKVLVIGQFGVTVALIIGSLVVYKQIQFVNEQNLGFNMSQMLIIKGPELSKWDSTFIGKQNTFTAEIKQISNVLGAAYSWRLPGDELGRNFDVRRSDVPGNTHFTVRNNSVSKDFINLYQMKLVAGRNFIVTDYNFDWSNLHNIIINEKAAKLFGFKPTGDAVGKQVTTSDHHYNIVGVVANFHQKSLRYQMEPVILFPGSSTWSQFSVKVNTSDLSSTISALKKEYDEFFPNNLFDYYFLDDRFNNQYSNDQLFGKVFAIFSGFAIFIACLGLYGLTLFMTESKTKEIGVRKVLGASVKSIVSLFAKDFIKWILIANYYCLAFSILFYEQMASDICL